MSSVASRLQRSATGAGRHAHPAAFRILNILWLLVLGAVSMLVLWLLFVELVDMDPLVQKTPGDVWRYLFSDPKAAANRDGLTDALRTTLVNLGIGYVIGIVAGVVVSSVFMLSPAIRRTFLPFSCCCCARCR